MSKLQAAFIFFWILFIIIFIIDYFFVKRRYLKIFMGKKKSKKKNEMTEIAYLVGKFKLDKNKLPMGKLVLAISILNAFIISLVAVVVLLIDTFVFLRLILGFVLLMALIYALYEILGRYLERRGYTKNGK